MSGVEPGFSGSDPAPIVQQPEEDEGFDMNNNDPNNNTEFNDQADSMADQEYEGEPNDMEAVQNQLLNEARTIHSILRQYTIEEIYSYLEASIDHPQRLQVVMHSFLARDPQPVDTGHLKELKRRKSRDDSPPPHKKDKNNDVVNIDSDLETMGEETIDLSSDSNGTEEPFSPTKNDVNQDDLQIPEPEVEAVVPHPETQLPAPLVVPIITVTDAPQEEHVKNDLKTLTEMFPTTNKNVLEEMYMQIYPIEAERTLDILVMQMLDMEDARPDNAANVPHEARARVEEAGPAPVTNGNEPQALPEVIPAGTVKPIPGSSKTENLQSASSKKSTKKQPKYNAAIEPVKPGPSTSTSAVLPDLAGPSTSDGGNTTPGEAVAGPSTESAIELDETDSTDSDKLSEDVQNQLTYLLEVLPNADPSFLKHKCIELKNKDREMREFLTDALENHSYPTLEDYNKTLEAEEVLKKFTGRLSVKEFLKSFPDPEAHFTSKRNDDQEYYDRSLTYLKGRFRFSGLAVIKKVLSRTRNLTLTVQALTFGPESKPELRLKKARSTWDSRETANLPDRPYLPFIQEIFYLNNKDDIETHLRELSLRKLHEEEAKKQEFEQAKARGELLTCGCCYDSECLITDMSTCPEGHLFCKECIRRFVETEIGDGRTKFTCLEGDCKEEFTLAVLQDVLATNIFSRLLQKKQVEEVAAANIEGLENCPFCDFGAIPAPGDRIFHCMNPECKKDSCRECREPSHIPLRCDEVEKDEEVKARKFIEDRMTEALVRECWKCHKKFVKIDGCNKMTCTCGAKMCYLCREPIKDYDHFNNNKCQLHTNNEELHVRQVREEAERALKELKATQPDVKIKHDVTKGLPTLQPQRAGQPAHVQYAVNQVHNLLARQLQADNNNILRQQMNVLREELNANRRRQRQHRHAQLVQQQQAHQNIQVRPAAQAHQAEQLHRAELAHHAAHTYNLAPARLPCPFVLGHGAPILEFNGGFNIEPQQVLPPQPVPPPPNFPQAPPFRQLVEDLNLVRHGDELLEHHFQQQQLRENQFRLDFSPFVRLERDFNGFQGQ